MWMNSERARLIKRQQCDVEALNSVSLSVAAELPVSPFSRFLSAAWRRSKVARGESAAYFQLQLLGTCATPSAAMPGS